MKNFRNIILLAVLVTSVVVGQEIEVRKLDHNHLEFTLTTDEILNVASAQQLLWPRAKQKCGAEELTFGKYRFEGIEPVSRGNNSEERSSFQFIQEVTCGPAEPVLASKNKIGIRRDSVSQELEPFIKSISLQFLNDRSTGAFKNAYVALSKQMRSFSTFEEWSEKAQKFTENSGDLKSATIWRVTVYENPPRAPMPGTYIAADYEIKYENISLQCGYLIWYKLPKQRYVILREEYGILPAKVTESVSDEQLSQVKVKLGCTR